jgi:hypothetical protein
MLKYAGWRGMDWVYLALDWYQWRALMNMVINLRAPQNDGKFLSSGTASSF